MSERVDEVILIDILQSMERIMAYSEKHNSESFINDRLTVDGVLMHIIVFVLTG